MRFMTYNVGGLASDAYDVFMAAMYRLSPKAKPHIICLQETHWKHSTVFTTAGWHVITCSSSSNFKSSGFMVMISHDLLEANLVPNIPLPFTIPNHSSGS